MHSLIRVWTIQLNNLKKMYTIINEDLTCGTWPILIILQSGSSEFFQIFKDLQFKKYFWIKNTIRSNISKMMNSMKWMDQQSTHFQTLFFHFVLVDIIRHSFVNWNSLKNVLTFNKHIHFPIHIINTKFYI